MIDGDRNTEMAFTRLDFFRCDIDEYAFILFFGANGDDDDDNDMIFVDDDDDMIFVDDDGSKETEDGEEEIS